VTNSGKVFYGKCQLCMKFQERIRPSVNHFREEWVDHDVKIDDNKIRTWDRHVCSEIITRPDDDE